VVDIPAEPIKVDRGTVVFAWPPQGERRMIVKVYGQMGVLNWMRKQVVGTAGASSARCPAALRPVDCCEPLFWGRPRRKPASSILATREVPGAAARQRAARLAPERVGSRRVFEQSRSTRPASTAVPHIPEHAARRQQVSPSGIVMVDLEVGAVRAGHPRLAHGVVRSRELVQTIGRCMGNGYARVGPAGYRLDEEITRVDGVVPIVEVQALPARRALARGSGDAARRPAQAS
jgi:hypothetical protein